MPASPTTYPGPYKGRNPGLDQYLVTKDIITALGAAAIGNGTTNAEAVASMLAEYANIPHGQVNTPDIAGDAVLFVNHKLLGQNSQPEWYAFLLRQQQSDESNKPE